MRLIDDLMACSSLQQELDVLQAGLSSVEMRTLMYTHDYTKDYAAKMPISPASGLAGNPTDEMFGILDDILNGTIEGKRAWSAVTNYASVHGELIKMVANKSLVSGVGEVHMHAAFTSLIPEYNIQRISDYLSPIDIYYPILCEPLLKGTRVTIRRTYNSVVIRDMDREVVLMKELEDELMTHPMVPCVLDCIILEDGFCEAIDYLTLAEFDASKCVTRLRTRKGLLKVCIKRLKLIRPIISSIVTNEDDLKQFDPQITVIKDLSGVYLDNSWSKLA